MGCVIDSTCHKFKMGRREFKWAAAIAGAAIRVGRPADPELMRARNAVERRRRAGSVALKVREIRRKMLILLLKTAEIGFGCMPKAECGRSLVD